MASRVERGIQSSQIWNLGGPVPLRRKYYSGVRDLIPERSRFVPAWHHVRTMDSAVGAGLWRIQRLASAGLPRLPRRSHALYPRRVSHCHDVAVTSDSTMFKSKMRPINIPQSEHGRLAG